MSWKELAAGALAMVEFGRQRFAGDGASKSGVAYLATVKKDGGPWVHPVTPIIGEGRLFLFMEPSSPRGFDQRRDGRYALHCLVADSDGGQSEFRVIGRAELVEDSSIRSIAAKHASYAPAERYILFELAIDMAFSTEYDEEGTPARNRWSKPIG
jgi:hypothetical protein